MDEGIVERGEYAGDAEDEFACEESEGLAGLQN